MRTFWAIATAILAQQLPGVLHTCPRFSHPPTPSQIPPPSGPPSPAAATPSRPRPCPPPGTSPRAPFWSHIRLTLHAATVPPRQRDSARPLRPSSTVRAPIPTSFTPHVRLLVRVLTHPSLPLAFHAHRRTMSPLVQSSRANDTPITEAQSPRLAS
ncbi:hypothetical protein BJ912DRAFT_1068620 [Pholiota molesta]|nr:hypothetical protein BJ912DRAFT_1068620 [Pholiota molesta]